MFDEKSFSGWSLLIVLRVELILGCGHKKVWISLQCCFSLLAVSVFKNYILKCIWTIYLIKFTTKTLHIYVLIKTQLYF